MISDKTYFLNLLGLIHLRTKRLGLFCYFLCFHNVIYYSKIGKINKLIFLNFFLSLSISILQFSQVIRARLQEQGHAHNNTNKYVGVMDCIRKVYQKEGIPGFYRGYATNLLRTTPAAVITFTSYEMIHRRLLQIIPT